MPSAMLEELKVGAGPEWAAAFCVPVMDDDGKKFEDEDEEEDA